MPDDGEKFLLCHGQVFEQTPGEENVGFHVPQRVLWVDRAQDLLVTIGIEKQLKKPKLYPLSQVEQLIARKLLRFIESDPRPYAFLNESDLPKISKDVRDRGWEIIQPLVDDHHIPQIYLPGTRGALVSARAAELGKEWIQVYRPLYKYFAYGCCDDALLGRYDRCGCAGSKQAPKTAKRGRRPDRAKLGLGSTEKIGPSIADVRNSIIEGIDRFWKPGTTIKKAWQDTKNAFFSQGEIDHRGLRIPIPPEIHQTITYKQFWLVFREEDYRLDLTKKHVSTTTWALKYRGVLGSSRQGVFGPCARYEIDSTIVDVYLVSAFNRAWVIGRPVLYVVVDVFSRMVVGFYLGLEGPSWEGARLALFNAFTSKVDFCRRFGVEITEDMWPCHHLPHKVLADNSEMKSKASDALPKALGIKLQNATARRGDWKPNVERQFRLINDHTVHFLPGALNPRLEDVKQRQYRLDACLTIGELTRILIRRLIIYNWSAYQSAALPNEMLGANLTEATPIAVWNWGLENLTGGAKSISKQKIWTYLLTAGTGTIRPEGIYFSGRHYASDRAIKEEWFARVRTTGKRNRIELRYVPDWPEFIWIPNPRSNQWEPCKLLDREEQYRLARIEEILDRAKLLSLASDEIEDRTNKKFAVFEAECNDIAERAEQAAAKAKKGLSKTEKTANIDSNRTFEKTAERVERARDAAESYGNKPVASNVIPLRRDLAGPDPLEDLWDI
ncbi:DDE-type integrase/transposase/recombinase [Noviherbaspirillum sp. UKPF54]|uniref:DDE-type integrase/transposase/recombinase n=1 Tax=Noviherbaspirillum sp. UKPF54 TaxID=2601898 RepID=UPI00143DB68F|nr:DDE-type integrase/transposase/recombinase [Noviherbaspirillum sp. UKPF54]